MKENLNPSAVMQSDCTQRLLKCAYNHIGRNDRRAQRGQYQVRVWTQAKIYGNEYFLLTFLTHEN